MARAWDHFIKLEHARQLVAQAKQWREDHPDVDAGGYVIVYEWKVCGWKSAVGEGDGWLPGCIAVPEEMDRGFFIAVGGDQQKGADRWVSLDIREAAERPATDAQKPPLTAREGLNALVSWILKNRFCSSASHIRELLLSLYNGDNRCDLSSVQLLDTTQRKQVCALLLGIGRSGLGNCYDFEIRDTVAIAGGEAGLKWFFAPTGELEKDLLRDFMASAQRNLRKAVTA